MNRRHFLAFSAGLIAAPSLLQADPFTFYVSGNAEADMAAGKIVFLDFWTNWCPTCAAQNRVLTELTDENPAYKAAMSFYKIDWDVHSDGVLSKSLAIPRRSTLVLLDGKEELGRIVAGTSKSVIKKMLDQGLAASQA